MAFSDFKSIAEVQVEFNIKYSYNDFFGVLIMSIMSGIASLYI